MSYNYRVLNDNPLHFYPLEGGSFADLTGRANATALGTPTQSAPLVVGGGNSIFVDGNNHFRFATSVFHLESPYQPFTLEAWFKPLNITGPKGIIGHDGQDDGLYFDGERIIFATDHGPAGRAEAAWYPPDTYKALHVIGVHTESRNELFVNGVRVASVTLTQEQLLAGYNVTSNPGNLFVGHRPGSMIVDSVAVYAHPLTSRQAKLHFLWGRDVPDFRDVTIKRNGTYWDFSDETALVAFDFGFQSTNDWGQGLHASVDIENDILSPKFDANGVSVESVWMNGFILDSVADRLDGSKIWWDGDGSFTVSVSFNGTTWLNATNGREIPQIPEGFVTTGQSLQVRVVFPAGLSQDSVNRVRNLHLRFYADRDVSGSETTHTLDFTGSLSLANEVYQPIEHHDQMGVNFYSGYAEINSLSGVRTLEFWVKANAQQPTTPEWWHIFDYRNADGTGVGYLARSESVADWSVNGGTLYVNGKPTVLNADFAFTPGRWYHIIFVMSAASSNRLILNNNFQKTVARPISIGMMGTYPTALSAAEAASLYNASLGVPDAKVNEATGLFMADAAVDPVRAYSYSWSTVGSG